MPKLKFMILLTGFIWLYPTFQVFASLPDDTLTFFTLKGRIFSDACDENACHSPVSSSFDVLDENGQRSSAGRSNAMQNGDYVITGLKQGINYKIVIIDKEYLKNEFNLSVPLTDKYRELSRDLLVIPKKKGAKMAFHISPFEFKKSRIRIGADEYLDEILSLIRLNPDIKWEIECYPDNEKNEDDNLRLTFERSNTVKSYLVSKGVSADNIGVHPNVKPDDYTPPPTNKYGKGKNYIGSTYLKISEIITIIK